MESETERLKYAQWILERNLGWIAASDVKTGVVVAVDTAMLAALAAAFSAAHAAGRTPWAWVFSVLGAAFLCFGVFCAAMALLPRITGPSESFIFSGCIIKNAAPDYADAFRRATAAKFLDDCLAQVHRNAQIASEKFDWVRAAILWSFIAVVPWVCALAILLDQ
jgi:hypothetical protein